MSLFCYRDDVGLARFVDVGLIPPSFNLTSRSIFVAFFSDNSRSSAHSKIIIAADIIGDTSLIEFQRAQSTPWVLPSVTQKRFKLFIGISAGGQSTLTKESVNKRANAWLKSDAFSLSSEV